MNEVFPILSGLLVGVALGLLRPKTRLITGVLAAIVFGTAATVVSGEYKLGWEFLLIDIPLVAASCAVSFLALRLLRRRQLETERH
jgi:high-affinity Fe2+/Pb2+ permease